jgi:hypothetical protein
MHTPLFHSNNIFQFEITLKNPWGRVVSLLLQVYYQTKNLEGKSMDNDALLALTEKEKRLIQMIRELGYGEIRIIVTDGQPVRAEEIKKSIKF